MLVIANAKYLYLQVGDTYAVVTTLCIILTYPKGCKSQASHPGQEEFGQPALGEVTSLHQYDSWDTLARE